MAVMYANALYQQGFAAAGFKALDTLYRASADYKKSKIYPGIPEYFNNEGRGLYHYLTGAGSWYLLTVITEMFGIAGCVGDLRIAPKLVKAHFDKEGKASVDLPFAGRDLTIEIRNGSGKEFGEYTVGNAMLDQKEYEPSGGAILIPAGDLAALGEGKHVITVELN